MVDSFWYNPHPRPPSPEGKKPHPQPLPRREGSVAKWLTTLRLCASVYYY